MSEKFSYPDHWMERRRLANTMEAGADAIDDIMDELEKSAVRSGRRGAFDNYRRHATTLRTHAHEMFNSINEEDVSTPPPGSDGEG